uniref:Calmodulin n=1 Tax=Pseudo-nitzschia australis TaxID=44445 RepID=A0A7S4ADP0_9STRA|mmetsp:Transcript_24486/g.53618  ORF Transcript_24486/g.53618 Transcript_24486/m.53618 type:complete len:219 (+) Transcript_24486:217-873(+)|eukprot:CAMPEP_0168194304 /NCGR_PEP_ID=MMETSP0139_2-20121125/19111_1 /TAXON_ID=44445 /ORGANISM="Pseudo-nitzschia australis, Strain 10249 10 AB" /LENGTH=218 /DNA_ID=CAMNT_0008117803 /DNA_START=157 /DNA_END=813 /DNA_ORIENTATION=+
MKAFVGILCLLTLMSLAVAVASQQYYDDYGEDVGGGEYYQEQDYGGEYYNEDNGGGGDSLYADYAKHQEDKAMGVKGGVSPLLKNAAVGAAGWFVGAKFHSRRAVKKSEKLSSKQQQRLYERYVQDVSALQMQNAQLQEYIQQTTVQQLTEEFIQADTNNDRKVSRLEFERYKADYLKKHPEADPSMFPKFEDFDPDHNGLVTLQEHEDYYRKQGMIA